MGYLIVLHATTYEDANTKDPFGGLQHTVIPPLPIELSLNFTPRHLALDLQVFCPQRFRQRCLSPGGKCEAGLERSVRYAKLPGKAPWTNDGNILA